MWAETCPHNELFLYKTTKTQSQNKKNTFFKDFFPVCSSFLCAFFLLYSEVMWSKNETILECTGTLALTDSKVCR